jgi:Tol biopolymer transport system component
VHRTEHPRSLVIALIGLALASTAACASTPTVSTVAGGTCDPRYAAYAEHPLAFPANALGTGIANLNSGWAPDSKRFAYADPSDGRIKVYDAQAAVTVTTMTEPLNARAPQWSADGRRVFFSARPPTTLTGPTQQLSQHTPPAMYVINADSTHLQRISIDSAMPVGPSVAYWDSTTPAKFSPDGRHVAFSTVQGLTSADLTGMISATWVMLIGDLTTTNGVTRLSDVRPVSPPSRYWHEVKGFTRDSRYLLYGASTPDTRDPRAGNPDVYTLDLTTNTATRYSNNPAWEETIDIDPAGPYAVFNTDRDNPTSTTGAALGLTAGSHHDLYLTGMHGDTGWVRRLTTDANPDQGGWDSAQPHWSPDGRHILFQQTLKRPGHQLTELRLMLLTFACHA